MRFKELIKNKGLIAIILSAMIVFGAFFCFKAQNNKIKELEKQIQIERNTTDQRLNYTETEVNVSSIERKFNTLRSYKIFDDTVNIKNKYHFSTDKLLGFKGEVVISASEDYYYQFNVDLFDYEIVTATEDLLEVNIPRPYLDLKSCHGKIDTYHEIKNECINNVFSNKEDARTAQHQWQGSYETRAKESIQSIYNSDNEQRNLNKLAKSEIKALLRSLGYKQHIKINIKEG